MALTGTKTSDLTKIENNVGNKTLVEKTDNGVIKPKISNLNNLVTPEPNKDPYLSFIIQQNQIPSGTIKPRHLAATLTMSKGDLYYSDGTNFIKLPIGTTGQTLKVVNGVPAWG